VDQPRSGLDLGLPLLAIDGDGDPMMRHFLASLSGWVSTDEPVSGDRRLRACPLAVCTRWCACSLLVLQPERLVARPYLAGPRAESVMHPSRVGSRTGVTVGYLCVTDSASTAAR
jgi:hypothetical protein